MCSADDGGDYLDSHLARRRLGPGDYTIEATTYRSRATGGYWLSVEAELDVLIEGLDGGSRPGVGTAYDWFEVEPAGAVCTSDKGSVTDLGSGRRLLAAKLGSLGDTEVTVECSADSYGTASAVSTLTALDPVSSVTVTGGECAASDESPPSGADQLLDCEVARGRTVTVRAKASGPSALMKLGWTAAPGASAKPSRTALDASVVGDTVVFARSGSAFVSCASDADVTLDVSVAGTVEHTTVLRVDCVPPVQITDYEPGERNGTDNSVGAGAMAASETDALVGTFNVAPASAICTAVNVGGIDGKPTPGGTGTNRTVTVSPAATGWLDIQVRCEAGGYATSTATARFRARPSVTCTVALGTLAHGTTTTTGTVGVSPGCVSVHRNATSPTATFHARRHTFTMTTTGWADIALEPTATGANALDTYLLLLAGHGSGGKVLRSHNNLDGDATRLDDVFLAAGNYTIEATTAISGAVGGYRLTVDPDFATEVTATVGQPTKHRFDYVPHDASVSVAVADPQKLAASVTAAYGSAVVDLTPARAGNTTATITLTAFGHADTRVIAVKAICAPGCRPLNNGTCVPFAPTLPEACAETLTEGRTNTFGRQWKLSALSDVYESSCTSVTIADKAAAYYRFTIPATTTSRRNYYAQIDINVPSAAKPFNGVRRTAPRLRPPELSLVVWKLRRDGTLPNATPVQLTGQQGSAADSETIRYLADLTSGDYIVEIAIHRDAEDQKTKDWRTDIASMFEIAVSIPRGDQMHDDARYLGNIGRSGSGASLGEFLDARASLNYNAHPDKEKRSDADNAFDPESPFYPWLVFTTDRCSIPPRWFLSLLESTIVGHFNEYLPGYLARLGEIDLIREEYLTDRPMFGGATVEFVYGCMRHDFNWRNFHRIHHHIDYQPPGGSWTPMVAKEANLRLKRDLEGLCDANLRGAPETHRHFDWKIGTEADNALCKAAVSTIRLTLDIVVDVGEPLSSLPILGIDYPHDG